MIASTKPIFMPALAEIFLSIGAIKVLLIGLFVKKNTLRWCVNASVLVLVAALFTLYSQPKGLQITFNGLFISDAFSILMRMAILITGGLVLLLTRFTAVQEELNHYEYPVLLLLALTGMMVMLSAHDLLSLFMGIELQSLSLYILVAMRRKNSESNEAALKYFVLGALSTGILLYGCSLVYGYTGLTNFEMLERFFKTQNSVQRLAIVPIIGMVLIVVALGFKIALAPLHSWAPDVYQGTPTSLTTFLATAPKITGLAVLMRVLISPFGGMVSIWQPLLILLSVLSMMVGSLTALTQVNVKRIIAYSSIGHMGFASIGILTLSEIGLNAAILYSIFYLLMTLLFFGSLLYLLRHGRSIEKLSDLQGLGQFHPKIAFLMGFTLLSMAGIPPLPGFIPKLVILRAVIANGSYWLAIIAVIYSVIAAAYYLLILKAIFLDKPLKAINHSTPAYRKNNLILNLVLSALLIVLVSLLIYPLPLLNTVHEATMALMYL
jgi:NADH-quinone oxidoreductase subunit N